MGDICTSSTAAWKKASVSQPDLQGELYVPMFCQIDGLCPPALVILPDDAGIATRGSGPMRSISSPGG